MHKTSALLGGLVLAGLLGASPGRALGIDFNNIALLSRGAVAYDNGSFSDYGIDQDAIHAIDDDPATYWAGLQGAAPQRITIGFASRQIIDRIRIQETPWAYFTNATFERYDGVWQPILAETKATAGMDRTFLPSIADSVRMTISGVVAPSSWYNQVACIIAFEVNAVEALEPNVALNAFAYDNGYYTQGSIARSAATAVDGDPLTYWAGLQYRSPQTMTVGFEGTRQIDRIRVWEFWGGGGISYFTNADFEYHDGSNWVHLMNHQKSGSHMDVQFPSVSADSVRIRINTYVAPSGWANRVACISEFEVRGDHLADVPDGQTIAASIVRDLGSYPNPFNPSTTIRYELGRAGRTQVSIFDARGAHVRNLRDAVEAEGEHEVTWDGTNEIGERIASGTYICLVESGGERRARKLLMVQ